MAITIVAYSELPMYVGLPSSSRYVSSYEILVGASKLKADPVPLRPELSASMLPALLIINKPAAGSVRICV